MKTQTQFQPLPPLQTNGKLPSPNGKFAEWMKDAGFRSYTQYSNDTLDAHMAPGRPIRERVFAWLVRNSWGRQCEFAMAGTYPAWQVDIASALAIDKGHVSAAVSELEEKGWVKVEGKLIYPQAQPPIEAAAEEPEAEDPAGLGIPDFETWLAAKKPEVHTRLQAALAEWNAVRKEIRRVRSDDYEQEVERLRALKVAGTSNGQTLPVPEADPLVPPSKSSVYKNGILIEKKANNKLASYEAKTHPDKPAEDPEKTLGAAIREMQARGCQSRLGHASPTTVSNLLKEGGPEDIARFLEYKQHVHESDHWNGWGLAVLAVRAELADWLTARAAAPPPAPEPEPEPVLTEEQQIEQSIEIALSLLDRGAPLERKHAAATVAKHEAENPELVASVRSRLARGKAQGGAV